jgi:hypothetical protein
MAKYQDARNSNDCQLFCVGVKIAVLISEESIINALTDFSRLKVVFSGLR